LAEAVLPWLQGAVLVAPAVVPDVHRTN
jgi:hypothetical protein